MIEFNLIFTFEEAAKWQESDIIRQMADDEVFDKVASVKRIGNILNMQVKYDEMDDAQRGLMTFFHIPAINYGWDVEQFDGDVMHPFLTSPRPAPALEWDFVKKHFLDYHVDELITLSNDMNLFQEYAELKPYRIITNELLENLLQAVNSADKDEYWLLNKYHINAARCFIGKTLKEACAAADAICYLRAGQHYSINNKVSQEFQEWLDLGLQWEQQK